MNASELIARLQVFELRQDFSVLDVPRSLITETRMELAKLQIENDKLKARIADLEMALKAAQIPQVHVHPPESIRGPHR